MVRILVLFCATFAWRAMSIGGTKVAVQPATVSQIQDIFQSYQSNATATFSSKAFDYTFKLDQESSSKKGDSVWPYLLQVRGDTLTSTSDTNELLKDLFNGEIPKHRVIDKSRLQVFLSIEQLPDVSTLETLSVVKQSVPARPLAALPIGTRIGSGIFEQIARLHESGKNGGSPLQFLVTVRDIGSLRAFEKQIKRDLEAQSPLIAMERFRNFESQKKLPQDLFFKNAFPRSSESKDLLFQTAFPNRAPSKRFERAHIESTTTSNRVFIAVPLKHHENRLAALLYLSFYFARDLEHVVYVDARPHDYPLAANEGAFVQRGAYHYGECDPMTHHGLLGQGQIIGLVDTGIDIRSSYLFGGARNGPVCNTKDKNKLCGSVAPFPEKKSSSATLDGEKFFYNNGARVVVRYDVCPSCDNHDDKVSAHGTFLAGVIAGAPNPSRAYTKCQEDRHQEAKGVGRAKISFYDVGFGSQLSLRTLTHDYKAMFRPAYAIGARVFTVAWGSGTYPSSYVLNNEKMVKGEGLYTGSASDIDSFMYDHKDVLVVVAAGNSGPGFVTSPAISKNALTVGSLSASGTGVSYFSAGGKQPDGRMKPDLIAMGDRVLSVGVSHNGNKMSHCETAKKSGTSVSTAVVSAAAAQVRQYFQKGFYPSGEASKNGEFRQDLWGSTVKAVLIAGATPLTDADKGGRLGTNEGYGSLILNNVLTFKDDNQIDLYITQGKISAGEPYEHVVEIESDEKPLVVTLAWTGPEAVLGTISPIINQLELSIQEDLTQLLWSTEANMNQNGNVKRFYIRRPTPGRYRISIKPSFVRDVQDFSLVITGRFADKQRVSPVCCPGTTIESLGTCLSVDVLICIIFVVIVLVVLIAGVIVLAYRRSAAQKAADEQRELNSREKDDLHAL